MSTITDNPDSGLAAGDQRYGDESGHSYFRCGGQLISCDCEVWIRDD